MADDIKKVASEKLTAYQRELKQQKVRYIVGSVVVGFIAILFLMIISGDRFNYILGYFGLSGINNQEGGVYADCSKRENKDNPYCQEKLSPQQQNWDSIRKGGGNAPFTLHDN